MKAQDKIILNQEKLTQVLGKMLVIPITRTDYEIRPLQGGTLGDVNLIMGAAETADGKKMPYKVVWKKQKKWERYGDPNSWRREYDLYQSCLGSAFTSALRWPECYHSELREGDMELWLEYIDGVSSSSLTLEMLEQAALELGRFQGRLTKQQEDVRKIPCLGDEDFLKREFSQWHAQSFTYDFLISGPCRMPEFLKQMLKDGDIQLVESKSFEYGYLRSRGCDIPEHLKKMLMDIDDHKDEIFDGLKSFPVVLCHRDFWNENIFCSGGEIRLIDWDTTGWGYLGEDIASLIVDGMDVHRFEENYRRLVPAYLKGISEHMPLPAFDERDILTMILVKFGYRMLQEYMFSDVPEEKNRGVNALQKIYEMRSPAL